MKHLPGFWLAILLVSAVALPAWATVDIGGYVCVDAYYYQQDKEGFAASSTRATPGSGGVAGLREGMTTDEEDREQIYFDLNRSSHLRFNWTNDEGIGMFMTPYMHGDPRQSGGDAGFKVGISNAVGWWDITPNFRLIAGKGGYETIFSDFSPNTTMGYDGVAKVIGYGYGNIGSSFQNGIRFTYKLSPRFSVKLGLLESRLTDNGSPDPIPDAYPYHSKPLLIAQPGTVADNSTVLPKFELAAPMFFRFGGVGMTLLPSGMYMKQTFDNIAPGADDGIVSYGLSLGGTVQISKFQLKTEVNYGQNLYNAGRSGVATTYPFKSEYATSIGYIQSARADAAGKVHDAETAAGWVEVNFKLGKFQPALYYGRQEVERKMPSADSEATAQFYGFNCNISLPKNFIITPEIMIYDNGDGKLMGGEYKFGQELLAGTQLRWIF